LPDGRFLIDVHTHEGTPAPIPVIQNWQGGLQPAKSNDEHSDGIGFRPWQPEAKK
jgi:hypothetical protein